MTAGVHNFTLDQKFEAGSTYDKTIPLIDLASNPLDFTATGFLVSAAEMHLRKSVDEPGPPLLVLRSINLTQANNGVTGIYINTAVVDGLVRVVISESDLADLSYNFATDTPNTTQRTGTHQVEVSDDGTPPKVWRILEGVFEVSPENTREDDGTP